MEYGKRRTRNISRCLECGDTIAYGRTDKKFCCEECRNRHHNLQRNMSRNMKRKVLAQLDRNYRILDMLVGAGSEAIWLDEAVSLGFNPVYVTSFIKGRNHCRCSCYDISFILTGSRISSISKIQNLCLNLQAGQKDEGRM